MAFPAIRCAASPGTQSLLGCRLDPHTTAARHPCTAGGLRCRPVFGSKGDLCSASLVARSFFVTGSDPHLTAALRHRLSIGSNILQRRHIPALHAKPASDTDLLQFLQYRSEQGGRPSELRYPCDPPFEIQYDKANFITMRRKYGDETIEVIVGASSEVHRTEPDPDYVYEDSDGSYSWLVDDSEYSSRIPLIVRVQKGEMSPILEFICTSRADDHIKIDGLSLKRGSSDRRMHAYEGPDFNDLDENMRKAFHDYLEMRGISGPSTRLFHLKARRKRCVDKQNLCRSVKQFVEK